MFRITLILLAMTAAAQAQIHDEDIILYVDDDRITTGTEEGAGTRIFTSTFDGGFTDEPGFDSFNETFDPGELLGLDILRALHVWNGEDFWPIADSTLTISKFGQEIETPACDHRVSTGFVFGNADANGSFHHHVSFLLNEPAAPGVYLLALELWSQDGSPAPSAPAYVVFDRPGHGFDASEAAQWVVDNLGALDCPADMNADGTLNILDFVAMQLAFEKGDLRADHTGDCELDILDFVAFQELFVQGCGVM